MAGSLPRIIGVDVARTFALLGMVTAHLVTSQGPDGEFTGWFQLVAGRSSALFAVLAGVSIALVTDPRRADTAYHRPALAVRALLVAGLGLVLGGFPSGLAVILTYYGVLFLLALPVLRWRAGPLALLALGWMLASPVVSQLLRPHLPETSYQVPHPLSLADPWQLTTELLVAGYYPVLTWGTYLFAGMALGRLDLRSRRWDGLVGLGGLVLAVFAIGVSRWVVSMPAARQALVDSYDRWHPVASWADLERVLPEGLYGVTPTGSWWWLGVWSPHSGSIVDLAHTTGCAAAVLGLCLLLVRWTGSRARRAWQVAFGAGAMTLTLYTTHVLVVSLPEAVPLSHSLAAHLVAVLVVGAAFALVRARGPLEQLVSQLSLSVAGASSRGPDRP